MKLLYCTLCGDIIAPIRLNHVPRWCVCKEYAVWWEDGVRGILRVHTKYGDRSRAFVLGINNSLLLYDGPITADVIKEIHDACPDTYLFKRLGTPLIRIRPGESNDTAWESTLPPAQEPA